MHLITRLATVAAAIALVLDGFGFATCSRVAWGQRYTVLQNDGTRLEGNQIQLGGQSGDLLLDGKAVLAKSVVWIRDHQLRPIAKLAEFVEMHNGDRLPGKVVAYVDPGSDPPHFVVTDGDENRERRIRVNAREVRRIAWSSSGQTRYKPRTLFLKSGSEVAFRSARFERDLLQLLMNDGIRSVRIADVAEIHYGDSEAWDVYLREQAILNPNGESSLLRIETASGLVLTGSKARYQLAGQERSDDRSAWRHQIQPMWSLDLISVPDDRVFLRRFHEPGQIPLTRLGIERSLGTKPFGVSLPRMDRNVVGDALTTSDGLGGWGVGVHAPSVLTFSLPPAARGFRTKFGLDKIAGSGGCVKARVWVDSRKTKPIFESDLLVGAERTYDTGQLALHAGKVSPSKLILEVDSVPVQRPAGADPLNIRDFFDWVEPVVTLDAAAIRQQVLQLPASRVPAWSGWELAVGNDLNVRYFLADAVGGQPAYFRALIQTGGKPLLLAKDVQLGPQRDWLSLAIFCQTERATSGQIEVRVDGRPIARTEIPRFNPAKQAMPPPPLSVSLERFASRAKPVRLELAYAPMHADESVCWRRMEFIAGLSKVPWRPLLPMEVKSLAGTKLSVLPDHTVLASGPNPAQETYFVTARIEQDDVTAVRLDALTDASLPAGGPGRAANGDFALTHAAAVETESVKELEKFQGRFVRVELPGKDRILSLAEVQVFSGGRNVAIRKSARASSELHGGVAAKAVDGHTNGIFKRGSITHTATEANPWWEVDLGKDRAIDRILLWNRTGIAHERLANHLIRVLDNDRATVWERANPNAPFPFVAYGPFIISESAVEFSGAAASHAASNGRVERIARIDGIGRANWSVGNAVGRPHSLILYLSKPAKLKGKTVTFRLVHNDLNSPQNLGRFRLSTTNKTGLIEPNAPATIVPLLSE